jgi:hypothetical protein
MVRQIVEFKRASDKVPELIQLAFKLVKLAPEPQKTVAATTGVIIQQVPQTYGLNTQVEPSITGLTT